MRKKSGFSLMEMMVVLLIISVVAAASAPMINKKMVTAASEKSPWVWVGNEGSIGYNVGGGGQTALIGTMTPPNEESLLHINTNTGADGNYRSSISFTNDNNSNLMRLIVGNNNIWFSTLDTKFQNIENSIALGAESRVRSPNTIAIGYQSDASRNSIAIGDGAQARTDNTIVIGNGAKILQDTSGTNSIAIGRSATTDSQYTIAIGDNAKTTAGANNSATDSIAIGNSAKVNKSYSIAIGPKAELAETNSIAIGNTAKAKNTHSISIGPAANTSANNTIAFADHASANTIFGMAFGSSATSSATSALAIGANSNASGSYSIALGGGSIYNGTQTTATAEDAISIGKNAKVSVKRSIALGDNADVHNSNLKYHDGTQERDSYGKIAIGASSYAKGGGPSIAIGSSANAYGIFSTAIGGGDTNISTSTRAMGGNSIAIGRGADAGRIDTNDTSAGSNAIAIGYNAVASGNDVIALGRNAKGGKYTSGNNTSYNDNSIAIGKDANASATNSTAIGNGAQASNTSSTAIGNGAVATTNNTIVLGTSSDTVFIPGDLVVGGSTYLGAYNSNNSVSSAVYLKFGGGRIRALYMPDVSDTYTTVYAKKRDNGEFSFPSVYSDRRLKNVGKAFVSGLDAIKKLEVFNYTYKKDKSKTPHVGVIAQDLQKIFPNAVTKGEDGFLRIRMEEMFYALVNAVKELDEKIEKLQNQEVATLKNRVAQLEKENKAFEKRLAELEKKIK